jgi:hypothetical protein
MEYKVYVKTDQRGNIVAINNDEFISSLDGWTEIDSGAGDRYHYAQNNYLPKPIMDERHIYRYKLMDGKTVERTQEEMDADYVPRENKPTEEERLSVLEEENKNLKEALELLLSGVTEEGEADG